jgi:hypothetical protein
MGMEATGLKEIAELEWTFQFDINTYIQRYIGNIYT